MTRFHRFVLLLSLTTYALGAAPAAAPGAPSGARPHARAARFDAPPKLDGVVNDPVWQQATPTAGMIQKDPDEGTAATERTEVRFGFDDKNLYIGIICFDSRPAEIVSTQNRRDGALTDTDSIQILLDTFHDGHNAVIFGTTPSGIEYDAQVSKGGQGDNNAGKPGSSTASVQTPGAAALNLNWDAVWEVKSQITPRGWEAEMAIPLTTLRYPAGKDKTWGVQVQRVLRRRNELSFWAPLSRAFEITQVDAAGEVEGFDLKVHRELQVVPYVLGGVERDYTRAGDPGKWDKQAGVDVKYSLTGSLTLDATVNTDFAQVEVDEQQINLTRFNLFFPEKRPFFLENAGIFDFGTPQETEIFFSRRIGIDPSGTQIPIDAGVRVSGTIGRWEVGVLGMKTREVDNVSAANDFNVIRVKRDLPNRSSLGFIAVDRERLAGANSAGTVAGLSSRAYNRTFGVDTALGFGKFINFQAFLANSQTPGVRGPTYAGAAAWKFDDSHHQLIVSYKETAKNFDPEVGYLQRAGFRHPTIAYRRTFYRPGSSIRSIFPHFQLNRWYTLGSNDLESTFYHFDFSMNWQSGAQLIVPVNHYYERLDKPFQVSPGVKIQPGGFGYTQFAPQYTTNQSSRFFGSAQVILGQFYNGTQRSLNLAGSLRKGQKLVWSATYNHNVIDLPAGGFTADLMGFKFNWSFTPKRYLQTFTQYNSTTHQIGTNVRLALLSTSSNGLYIVYNNGFSSVDYTDPRGDSRMVLANAFIVKYNYRFNF